MDPVLSVGDRVCLSGGYDPEPAWMTGHSHYLGTISHFIPGQNDMEAAVVQLDLPITFEGMQAEVLVLELRYTASRWSESNVVHVELCDFMPEQRPWQNRRKGKWVESHASYSWVSPAASN